MSWDQNFTEIPLDLMQMNGDSNNLEFNRSLLSKPFSDTNPQLAACNQKDPRNFRPLSVLVSLAIHKINGHLPLDIGKLLNELTFLSKRRYAHTKFKNSYIALYVA